MGPRLGDALACPLVCQRRPAKEGECGHPQNVVVSAGRISLVQNIDGIEKIRDSAGAGRDQNEQKLKAALVRGVQSLGWGTVS